MPTLIRQKRSFTTLKPVDKGAFLSKWVNELQSRFDEVRRNRRHSIEIVEQAKLLADAKVKCEIIITKSKTKMSVLQHGEFDKRCAALYDNLKGYDKAVFGYERDVLRPNSDGAKKQKLIVRAKEDAIAVRELLNQVTQQHENSVNLYDSHGSNADVLDAVDNGRKLIAGLKNYSFKLDEFVKMLEEANAKTLDLNKSKEMLSAIHDAQGTLVERSERYVDYAKKLGAKYRGVTRRIAKESGVLKTSWIPDVTRRLGKSNKVVPRLKEIAYSGGDSFPEPVTIVLNEIRKLRVEPAVKELAVVCLKMTHPQISMSLTEAATIVKSLSEGTTILDNVTDDFAAVRSAINNALSSTTIRTSPVFNQQNKLALQKVVSSISNIVINKYLDQLKGYVEKYF